MRTLLAAAAVALLCVPPAAAATLEELTPYLSTQYFTWTERFQGRRLLKEEGALFSGGVVVGAAFSPVTLRGRGEIFGGEVGYRGETQAPDSIPVETRVSYLGSRTEADLGYRLRDRSLDLEPFGGIGYRWWLRDLHDTRSADGTFISGYTETWRMGYGRLGARARTFLGAAKIVAEGGMRYPFYTGNTIDFVGSGETTFRPKGRLSGFGEAGITYRNFNLVLSYEGFRFDRSDLKAVQGANYFQPDSSSDIFGMRLGWTFR